VKKTNNREFAEMDIQKDTYVKADEEMLKGMTFDLLVGLHNKIDFLHVCYDDHMGKCEKRFQKLENRKKIDTTLSAGTGIIGGFLAWITSGWLK